MHGGVGAELLGQSVPLHAGAEAVDDAVEDGAEVGAGSAGAGRRVVPGQEVFDDGPKIVGDNPDGFRRRDFPFRAGHATTSVSRPEV